VSELRGTHDMQASAPPVALALSRAGVTRVQKAIRIRRGDQEMLMAAEIDCTVDLGRDQKGVHMSRFPELFDEAIDAEVLGEGLLIEVLAEHIARHIVERQEALRAEVHIAARWPLRRETPVSGLPTQEMVSLIGIAAAVGDRVRRVGVRERDASRRGRRGDRDQRLPVRAGPRARPGDGAPAGGRLRRR
jgi:GTP cyclohydrolase-4